MTCIIATIYKDKVHMVGDSCGSDGFVHQKYPLNPKVFKNGDFILGYTSSYRMGQLLQYSWEPPRKSADDSDNSYIFNKITDSLIKCFKANDYGEKDGLEFEGGNFLLGWKGRLFEVQPNMSILEYSEHASVGCGMYHALASVETLKFTEKYKNEPEKLLATALKITSQMCIGVSEEYTYIHE